MRHYNQRYAFVSAARLDMSAGVGPAPMVLGLMRALAGKGKKVALVAPPATLRLPSPWLERWFNYRLAHTLSELAADVVIGFDGDGYRFARAVRQTAFVCFVTQDPPVQSAFAVRTHERFPCGRLRAASRAADLIVVTSRHAQEQIGTAYGVADSRFAIVSPGIDSEAWSPRTLPEHDRPRVLAVANHATAEEWRWLLDGCLSARREGLEFQLQVCGARHPAEWSKQAARAGLRACAISVDARGRHSDLKSELGAADLFVQLAHRFDGAPQLLWAMALGRPVIVPDTGTVGELAGDAAFKVPPRDAGALCQALSQLLQDRNGAETWAQRGIARASQFTWDRQARLFGERLAEL